MINNYINVPLYKLANFYLSQSYSQLIRGQGVKIKTKEINNFHQRERRQILNSLFSSTTWPLHQYG